MSNPYILYDDRLADGTPTATTTASGYDVKNLTDWRPYTYWKAGSNAIQYITVDCGAAKAADSLAIYGHDLFTQVAQVSVECSSDNFATDITQALAPFSPSNNKAVFKTFTSQSKRYWRLKVANLTAAAYIGILTIGSRLEMEKPPLSDFDPIGEKPASESEINVEGQLLGVVNRIVEKLIEANFAVTDSWFNQLFLPAWDNHLSFVKPFLWANDIATYPDQVFLVRIAPDFSLHVPYMAPGYRLLSLRLVGVKE